MRTINGFFSIKYTLKNYNLFIQPWEKLGNGSFLLSRIRINRFLSMNRRCSCTKLRTLAFSSKQTKSSKLFCSFPGGIHFLCFSYSQMSGHFNLKYVRHFMLVCDLQWLQPDDYAVYYAVYIQVHLSLLTLKYLSIYR